MNWVLDRKNTTALYEQHFRARKLLLLSFGSIYPFRGSLFLHEIAASLSYTVAL
jgi:hypothetical protein